MPAVLVLVGMLAVRNVAGETVAPSSLYVPVNLALTAILAVVALASGLSAADLGLAGARAPRSLPIAAAAALVVTVVIAVAAAVPLARPLFEDQRVARVDSGLELVYQALVRIPLGTVVLEEFAFRGALLALLARWRSTAVAVAVSSSLLRLRGRSRWIRSSRWGPCWPHVGTFRWPRTDRGVDGRQGSRYSPARLPLQSERRHDGRALQGPSPKRTAAGRKPLRGSSPPPW